MGITAGTQPLPARNCNGGESSRALVGGGYTDKPLDKMWGLSLGSEELDHQKSLALVQMEDTLDP